MESDDLQGTAVQRYHIVGFSKRNSSIFFANLQRLDDSLRHRGTG